MIYVILEGLDDRRFFDNVLRPYFDGHYGNMYAWEYSSKPKEKIKNFVNTIRSRGLPLIFLADNDENQDGAKIDKILTKYPFLKSEDIFVVVKEIESWYIAGVNEDFEFLLKQSLPRETDDICKERFRSFFKDVPRSELMISILENYNLELARSKNSSLHHFLESYFA